jgi:hypothetical protein
MLVNENVQIFFQDHELGQDALFLRRNILSYILLGATESTESSTLPQASVSK